ncbi:MAG: TetR/AcrR family transcriptional regulator [Proteobacteria bacterium]|nr:TetR/AcrR family transcriptional regulator [Pseudomonadota bacterium]
MSVALAKPVRSARKPKGEGHVRRGEILQAAEKIFVECGYDGATIRKIADEVGVSSTALYMHFRDKSQILLEICQDAFEQMLQGQRELRRAYPDPAIRIKAMLKAYMEFGLANPNAYRLVFLTRPQEGSENDLAVVQALGRQVFEGLQASVAEIAAQGRLKAEVSQATQVMWAGVHGIVALIITKPYFAWAEAEALGKTMIDGLFEGLVSQ